ncbi:unnamed protein product [Phaeothamnion confervicola]
MAAAEPNNTIYIHNLNEKIKKPVLKKSLHSIFSQFGRIIDIVACRGEKLRGQAWVVFEDKAAATNAVKQMQGFPFYDKPMRIEFSKNESDVIARRRGTFVPREKRQKTEAAKGPKGPQQLGQEPAGAPPATSMGAAPTAVGGPGGPLAAPNSVLFAENLPAECTQGMLNLLFQQYRGLREVRMAAGQGGRGVAFVEFEDATLAGLALQGLAGFKLTQTDALQLSYAK